MKADAKYWDDLHTDILITPETETEKALLAFLAHRKIVVHEFRNGKLEFVFANRKK